MGLKIMVSEELEAENKRLKSMIADVIYDTGDDPEIMAASRAEWAARAFAAEAKLVDVTEEFDAIIKHDRTRIEELVSMVVGRDNLIEELEAKLAKAVDALKKIAEPRVGPDFDWTEAEADKWRASWYRRYGDIARATLAELKEEK